MDIPTITADELKVIMTLAMRMTVMEKSSLLTVPEYTIEDNAHQRAVLLESMAMTERLLQMGLLLDASDFTEFKEMRERLQERLKRTIRIYLLSPIGLGMYKSEDDVWTDEQKETYTTKLIERERTLQALKAKEKADKAEKQ